MSKITMAVAFGAGYVLGARAGRQRYEELRDRAQEFWSNPKVQKQAQKVQEQAKQVPGQAKEHLPASMGGTNDTDGRGTATSDAAAGGPDLTGGPIRG